MNIYEKSKKKHIEPIDYVHQLYLKGIKPFKYKIQDGLFYNHYNRQKLLKLKANLPKYYNELISPYVSMRQLCDKYNLNRFILKPMLDIYGYDLSKINHFHNNHCTSINDIYNDATKEEINSLKQDIKDKMLLIDLKEKYPFFNNRLAKWKKWLQHENLTIYKDFSQTVSKANKKKINKFKLKYFNEIKNDLNNNLSFLEIKTNLIIKYSLSDKMPLLQIIKNDKTLFKLLKQYESKLNKKIQTNNNYLCKYNQSSFFYQKINKELNNLKVTSEISQKLKVNINTVSNFINQHKELRQKLFNNIKAENQRMQKMSSLERQTYKLLFMNNINFKYQYIFKDCKNKQVLPFDFYIPNLNTAIELQGAQHYKSSNLFGGNEQFKIRKQNDMIKEKYCFDHHIILLKIHYSYNIKDVLIKNKIIKDNNLYHVKTLKNNVYLTKLPNYNQFIIYNNYLNNKEYIHYQYKQNLINDKIVNNNLLNDKINEFNNYNIRYTKQFKKELFEFSKENNLLQQINHKYHRNSKYFIAMAVIIFFNDNLLLKFIKKYNLKSVLDVKINFMFTDYDKKIFDLLLKNNIINKHSTFNNLLAQRVYHNVPQTNLSGKIINNIKLIRPVFCNTSGTWFYECRCFCGNVFVSAINIIKTRKNISCGCMSQINKYNGAKKIAKAKKQTIQQKNEKLKELGINWRYVKIIDLKHGHEISLFKCIFCGKEKEFYNTNILKNPYCNCYKSLKLKFKHNKEDFIKRYQQEINNIEKILNAKFIKIDRNKKQKEFYIFMKCNKCNQIYSRKIADLRKLQRCPICVAKMNSQEGLAQQFKQIYDKNNYKDYQLVKIIKKNNRTYYQIFCKNYGIFEISKANFERGTKCAINRIKCKKINRILLNKNIDFINQYRFEHLNKIPFDYFLPNKRIVIQIEPNFYRSKQQRKTFNDKLNIQKHFCKENDYKLIYLTQEQINML